MAAKVATWLALAALGAAYGDPSSAPTPPAGRVDAARLARAPKEPEQWLTNGRDGAGTYFSPLAQINAANIAKFGFAWAYALGTKRGLEGTPIVVDNVMYASGNWGRVYALEAGTGKEIWTFTPDVDGQWGRYACCDVVNRGVAVWQGRVYVGSLDGWLYALEAATGAIVWKADTLIGRSKHAPYTITGAPLVAGNSVVIGNGGADFGVRGYVSAYNLDSGDLRWRFFTVPHDPALGPQEQIYLAKALTTWDANSEWSRGGGGTVWDGMAYDAELKLIYIGTGNSSPYTWQERSPKGGDNLYLASIIAIHADDGTMAWYYQEIPGERWDYTATMKMVLADLLIDGKRRKALMQAPKNGYFYVLDRVSGELISAKPFAFTNWTKGIDAATGRPIPNPAAEYLKTPRLIFPSQAGAHSWQPMSYDPATGFVYIPVIEAPMVFIETSKRPVGLIEGTFTVSAIPPEAYVPQAMASLYGPLPSLEAMAAGITAPLSSSGILRAWDPVANRVVWSQPSFGAWSGGVMSTAGNLVFQGDAAGMLSIYAADTGKLLKKIDVGTSIMAAPMTYSIRGQQYVAVMAGLGGAGGFAFPPDSAAYKYGNDGRIVAFKLGGGNVPKPSSVADTPFLPVPDMAGPPKNITRGEVLYTRFCSRCHVFGRGLLPDLRRMSPGTNRIFYEIVLNGAFVAKGMARWDDVLSRSDAEAIHAYINDQRRHAYAIQQSTR